MKYRINQLQINPYKVAAKAGGIDKELLKLELEQSILKALRKKQRFKEIDGLKIRVTEIVRESIDARKKPDVRLVYTVDFECNRVLRLSKFAGSITEIDADQIKIYEVPKINSGKIDGSLSKKSEARPVVVGFGPCGIFAALVLAEAGLKPIVIERGKQMNDRIADVEKFWNTADAPNPESNVQFGEGGAGTFSDGKLTTGIKDIRIKKVLKEFVEAGANPEILYKHKPHIGTDKLRIVVSNLRNKIISLGGEVLFNTRFIDINFKDNHVSRIKIFSAGGENYIETNAVILAMGHSARDTFELLYEKGLDLSQKPFSIGVRIEHPQEMINEAQYGNKELAKILGAADYKLSYKCKDENKKIDGRGVYTFCMCPGGEVVNASTESGTAVTNGMSNSARNGEFANSALLVDVRTTDFEDDHPLAGIEFQKKYESLAGKMAEIAKKSENKSVMGLPKTTYGEFKDLSSSNVVRDSLPEFASEAIIEAMPNLSKRLRGFDNDSASMIGIESRSSSPVRMARDSNMNATKNHIPIEGIIPAGEGPGYAGGIMSASVDGIKAAEAVISNAFCCNEKS